MNSTIVPFQFDGQPVRIVTIDGEPWFVLSDLCNVLDIGNPSMVADRIDGDALSTAEVIDSLGRRQTGRIVSEPGMYEVVFLSRKPNAKAFKRWITSEVLPQIRRTGSYGATPALTGPELMAAALIEAQQTLEAHQAQVLHLTPRAEAWDSFLSSTGDYSVNEAAKILSRDHGIHTGEGRLRDRLEEIGWIYRQSGKPRASQAQINCGRMAEKASFYHHPETGEKVAKTPQVRITPKGIDALRTRLTEVPA